MQSVLLIPCTLLVCSGGSKRKFAEERALTRISECRLKRIFHYLLNTI